MTAGRTINTGYGKDKDLIIKLDLTFIRTIKDKTAEMTAGTGDMVQIDGMDRFIIKILRNIVVIICFYCYHSIGHSVFAMLNG